jgi:hypothetical protein
MKRELKLAARDKIIQACINEALHASERDEPELAEAIRAEATKLAKRLTPDTAWHGLPETL